MGRRGEETWLERSREGDTVERGCHGGRAAQPPVEPPVLQRRMWTAILLPSRRAERQNGLSIVPPLPARGRLRPASRDRPPGEALPFRHPPPSTCAASPRSSHPPQRAGRCRCSWGLFQPSRHGQSGGRAVRLFMSALRG